MADRLIQLISTLAPGVIAFIGVILGITVSERRARASSREKANEWEIKDLQKKLDSFYIPFLARSKANLTMAQDLRSRNSYTQRFLTKVFDKEWIERLPVGDQTIFYEICRTAEILEKFIADNIALADQAMIPYLIAALIHFRILHLAYSAKLGSDSAPFEKYSYPRQLEGVMELEIQRLNQRISILRSDLLKDHGIIPSLKIPQNLKL